MPSCYEVFENGATILELWTGVVTHVELLQQTHDQLQDTRISPGANVLVDATRARFETPAERIHEVASVFGKPDHKASIRKHALLVNAEAWDRAQILAREFQRYGVSCIPFTSVDIACMWLGLDPLLTKSRFDKMLSEHRG